jgi:hypothetical protein
MDAQFRTAIEVSDLAMIRIISPIMSDDANYQAFDIAIKLNRLDVVRYLWLNGFTDTAEDGFAMAVKLKLNTIAIWLWNHSRFDGDLLIDDEILTAYSCQLIQLFEYETHNSDDSLSEVLDFIIRHHASEREIEVVNQIDFLSKYEIYPTDKHIIKVLTQGSSIILDRLLSFGYRWPEPKYVIGFRLIDRAPDLSSLDRSKLTQIMRVVNQYRLKLPELVYNALIDRGMYVDEICIDD